jgi:hypothetical protein
VLTYRLYFRGPDGHIVNAEPFECWDDEQAIGFARGKIDQRPAELWQLARKVMVFQPVRRRTA